MSSPEDRKLEDEFYRSLDDSFYDGIDDDECYECAGEGWILDDCFEDTCCCANPEEDHDWIPCPLCNPEGKN